ncbi:hypothetical protein ABPG73_010157 [Tetrahymena malaccensis]
MRENDTITQTATRISKILNISLITSYNFIEKIQADEGIFKFNTRETVQEKQNKTKKSLSQNISMKNQINQAQAEQVLKIQKNKREKTCEPLEETIFSDEMCIKIKDAHINQKIGFAKITKQVKNNIIAKSISIFSEQTYVVGSNQSIKQLSEQKSAQIIIHILYSNINEIFTKLFWNGLIQSVIMNSKVYIVIRELIWPTQLDLNEITTNGNRIFSKTRNAIMYILLLVFQSIEPFANQIYKISQIYGSYQLNLFQFTFSLKRTRD